MPIVQITLVEGRDDALVENCIREVARCVSEQLNAPIGSVRVMVSELPPTRFAVGDRLKSDAPAS
ncbi:tautomerase family protein [Alloalcanivorax mobilis]|uniref:tautomerase family protein n=1 Tax=Alloalcanivorax mobilis TaxID=2019569 RepID=UPI000B5B4201|nr:tautomerase family protein [Alloalcanivorax mobilis]ASK34696.1 4-oxalocrotonate tautomerase [Alcanivorax sp. N3-2A]|tara:strand:- start:30432 stop:30626 length:195 start_codon:yes stop_codon:yes gene_type:complete